MLGAIVVSGERETSYGDLRLAVTSGRVDEVRVVGGLDPAARGHALAEVHWRDGLVRRVTEVDEASSRRMARQAGQAGYDGPVVVGRIDDRLAELDPELSATREGDVRGHAAFGSWRLPSWCGPVVLVVAIGALALLIAGPQPWRATRWAWFWLLWLAAPVGLLAFLLLGGPTRLWPPARPAARLTGGRAFLLALLAGLALGSLAVDLP